eukprot:gnl/MRDRNA2_/MRDRNA2_102471_c0_seq1.p1 gnl/MRDRNA2_/MRDRNA2_102471_c0~~gnl/MRDRNA2_/MRDRNA2_102471_c0_seq1.p1  ORF type:complete len:304 (-),score=19.88 gnl/MRDRNA2_/MRDRNA2_102471_c0_seq1:80-991(-)
MANPSSEIARNAISAGMTAATTASIFNPLDTLRVRWQLSPLVGGPMAACPVAESSILGYTYRIVVQEGFVAGLWRPGVLATVLSISTSSSIRMGLYPYLRDMVVTDPKQKTAGAMFGAGLCAGSIAYFVSCPFFQTKTKMQAALLQPGSMEPSCVKRCLQQTWHEGGTSALFRGSGPTVMRGALFTAGQTLGYDGTKTLLSQRHKIMKDGPALHFLGSIVAAFFATAFSAPADFVTTRYQAAPQIGMQYRNPVDCFKQIVMNDGVQVLFRGWLPNFVRIAPACVLFHPMYEQVRLFMGLKYLT